MTFPYPEHVLPSLVLLIASLTSQFEAEVPGATLQPYMGYRTHAEQAEFYARGRTKPGPIVTLAPPGKSKHNSGRAVDVVILCRGVKQWHQSDCDGDGISDYEELGRLAEQAGLEWGGRWQELRDPGHLEIK